MDDICNILVSVVAQFRIPDFTVTRCKQRSLSREDIDFLRLQVVKDETAVPANKISLLSNKCNKQSQINLIAAYLTAANIEIEPADEEGDADVVIVH